MKLIPGKSYTNKTTDIAMFIKEVETVSKNMFKISGYLYVKKSGRILSDGIFNLDSSRFKTWSVFDSPNLQPQ